MRCKEIWKNRNLEKDNINKQHAEYHKAYFIKK